MRLINSAPDCEVPGWFGATPFGRAARSRIVSRDHSYFSFRLVLKLLVNLFQIPATDLNVSFGIAQQTFGIGRHLTFEFAHAGFGGPLATHSRSHLHQTDLTVCAGLPWTEICFFVDDAPDELGIDAIDGGLPRDQRVEAMGPVTIKT